MKTASVILDNDSISLSNNDVQAILQRRSAGESLGALAREVGLSWQRLWTLLYGASSAVARKPEAAVPVLTVTRPDAPLAEKYRPGSLDALWGQPAVVKVLKKFAAQPCPTAFLFEGDTGTGKTSAALSLASAIGCDLAQRPQEFGGVYSIASGEQSADAVRETARLMHNCPFSGSGWKVVIVNEADRMARAAETIWLDVLEAIPGQTVIIFTTNESARLSQRFMDRCTRLRFESDADRLRASATSLAAAVWQAETGKRPDAAKLHAFIQSTEQNGQISFRRVMQELTVAIGQEDSSPCP